MDQIVGDDKLSDTFQYLDNITVSSSDQAEHDRNVKRFLEALRKRNLSLNQSKAISSAFEVNILRYCVNKGKIKPDPDRLKPLQELSPPHGMQTLKRVLGLFACNARWIPIFSNKL